MKLQIHYKQKICTENAEWWLPVHLYASLAHSTICCLLVLGSEQKEQRDRVCR